MNAICLVIDRLSLGYLGLYGNSWIDTPEFDAIAAQGLTFDQAIIDTPDLAAWYTSAWSGRHALQPVGEAGSLPQALAPRGVTTALVTDEPAVLAHPDAAAFGQRVEAPPGAATAPADDEDDTQFARLFSTAAGWLEDAREPFLLWVHCQGLAAPWDAPQAFRREIRGGRRPARRRNWSLRRRAFWRRIAIPTKPWACVNSTRGK